MSEFTTEDQLVSDLVDYWNENRPADIPDGIPFVNFRRVAVLPVPAIIVGHEGFDRETAKGMDGTGKVRFRCAIRTDADVMDDTTHRSIAAAMDRALVNMDVQPGPLALTYLHALLRESPTSAMEDRRQTTVLKFTVVCTRCEPE